MGVRQIEVKAKISLRQIYHRSMKMYGAVLIQVAQARLESLQCNLQS